MKIFMMDIARTQVVKVCVGLGVIAFAIRSIMGLGNMGEIYTVTIGGLEQFAFMMVILGAVLLLWDIRDRVQRRS